MILSLTLFGVLASAKISELKRHCPNTADDNGALSKPGYTNWTAVPEEDWSWDHDWSERIALGEEDIFPVGFRPHVLHEFNQPPICMHIPESGDKKVEILIEADTVDAQICIHDASDLGYANNDVGNVDTCNKGQLYACFTAAEAYQGATVTEEQISNGIPDDFSFYVYCQESCEAGDVNLWIRVRISEMTWETGKTGVGDDLEMWCEMEKGTTLPDNDDAYYFTYPSELIDDNPSKWPWKIIHLDGTSAASPRTVHTGIIFSILSLLGLFFCC